MTGTDKDIGQPDRILNELDRMPESHARAADAAAEAVALAARPYDPVPPADSVIERLRDAFALVAGRAQGLVEGLGGWVARTTGGARYARQQADLEARAHGLMDVARQVMNDPDAVAKVFADAHAAQLEAADKLEAAYASGHADRFVLQEAARIRSAAVTQFGNRGAKPRRFR